MIYWHARRVWIPLDRITNVPINDNTGACVAAINDFLKIYQKERDLQVKRPKFLVKFEGNDDSENRWYGRHGMDFRWTCGRFDYNSLACPPTW